MGGMFRKANLKKVYIFFAVALLITCGFCLLKNRTDVSAEGRDYIAVGNEPKLYDAIAKLSKGEFPSEYDASGRDKDVSGVYTLEEHSDAQYPVHFYKGDRRYTYNHVRFGGFCWMAVRTTDKGGVKLIYNGLYNEYFGECDPGTDRNNSSLGLGVYDDATEGMEHVGYMHNDNDEIPVENIRSIMYYSRNNEVFGHDVEWNGTEYTLVDTTVPGYLNPNQINSLQLIAPFERYHYTCGSTSTTCEQVYYVFNENNLAMVLSGGRKYNDFTNVVFSGYTQDSTIKTVVDNWYAENLQSYTSRLEDAVYCNDRTIMGGSLLSNEASLQYNYGGDWTGAPFASKMRVYQNTYSMDCPNVRDSFTVSSANGNGQLTYPIGLLTADEARITYHKDKRTSYLEMGSGEYSDASSYFWTMSPYYLTQNKIGGTLYLATWRNPASNDNSWTHFNQTAPIRPVITVNNNQVVYCGNGTIDEPFVLDDADCDHVYFEDEDMYKALRDCDLIDCPELKNNNAGFDDGEQMIRMTSRTHILNLKLDNSNLKDLSDLPVFSKMQNLSLRNNRIEDISPLTSFYETTSTIELASNNIRNTILLLDLCEVRTGHVVAVEGGRGEFFLPELCLDGSYEGVLNPALYWIVNQNLEDALDEGEYEYELPDTMRFARYLSEAVFDYQQPDGYALCDPEVQWCDEREQRRPISSLEISEYFDDGIDPEDLIYLENAELMPGEDKDMLRVFDDTKPAVLSYRINWTDLFGDAWSTMDNDLKSYIISETGGNDDYWNIATMTLHMPNEPIPEPEPDPEPESEQVLSPYTFDNICYSVAGLIIMSLSALAVIAKEKR